MPLKIAAKIDNGDRWYYEGNIEALMHHPLVDYLGELGDRDKRAFLAGARALLFPIDWPEPFGLVLIEALACGTPVIAFRRGSVPEIIEDRRTGFIVDNVDDAVRAVARLPEIDRVQCRTAFEQRFSAARMAADYLRVYGTLLDTGARGGETRSSPSLQGA
ncbi:MAG: glycosyltransferase [Trinickia sp.]|uniref:glycosyltransferase n=1 Tax=Trinickia sp. TaxID=2571163 RepID=UPI003F7D7010